MCAATRPVAGQRPLAPRHGDLVQSSITVASNDDKKHSEVVPLIPQVPKFDYKRSFSFAVRPQIRSLAVLPLVNLSGDPDQEQFADGMTEALITELSRISSLRVVSRTSVMRYKGERKKPLPQIGQELNMDPVIEGSILRADNRVRIAAHMVHSPSDQNLLAETYERDLRDVLKMQREIAESITERVRAKLTPEQQSRLREAPKVDPKAFQAYLAGTQVDVSGYQGIKTAQSYFRKASAKDSNFASAYTGLSAS